MKQEAWKQPFFSDKMPACALKGHWTSFCLVDEAGSGKAYGGLPYTVHDSTGRKYSGRLNADGFAKLESFYCGPVVLKLDELYSGKRAPYHRLRTREAYGLPITELQVRAEQTRFSAEDGQRIKGNPAQSQADRFYQVEVRDLVRHVAHLPPQIPRAHSPQRHALKMMADLGFGPPQPSLTGIVLFPNKHSVLEVRPLRALRPILSTDDQFCALNLYQLALMAALSYCNFGQQPPQKPEDQVSFPLDPTVGNLFADKLSGFQEAWRIDPEQTQRYYPLYEDVPYSRRFEILPFDPELYPSNHPSLEEQQEHPANLHFFDDEKFGTDTQAFITHHDEVILISVRGTASGADALRDANAHQVDFAEGAGRAHEGFYLAYRAMRKFVLQYLDQFHFGQRIIICGHSLGGAIALLLAEGLRRTPKTDYNILLYTYGAPRAADSDFTDAASSLVHHRIVNHNDPVPSVPATWMNTTAKLWIPGAVMMFSAPGPGGLLFASGLVRVGGNPYRHHGEQQHFMPIKLPDGTRSSVLWKPGCESIQEAGCNRAVQLHGDMPSRDNLLKQLFQASEHFMTASYIPAAWATLRRWQQTVESQGPLVTSREFELIDLALETMTQQLRDKRRELDRRRPPNQRGNEYEHNPALNAEVDRLRSSRQRLETLRWRRLEARDVYGSHAHATELQPSLKRWFSHRENRELSQFASIPPPSHNEPGRVYTLDIDSIV
ncbi:lipase family protein [Pseudomonas tolaasii]|uniref:Lipase family protein n=2 Tax=Pseudomonas tolaasii TaxID=29442 RepID=A0A7Y8DUG9_PSETO|nr:lipase family protein [Pseudomonas tolaasii]ARB30815.1 lipase [Pseudomonas tolaasii]KAB0467199.1 lipase family protein [Pseudomonas tolaasii]MBY8943161.1 lipase family protein [Pseudomonas tolaasii]NWC20160.1 lipase family protein [Pseudomonas tolaasii]NWC43538.1 lipase family protein [Pseudomonas tolaasii]